MLTANVIELVLTCSSWQEAQAVADALLEKQLITSAEFIENKDKHHWLGSHEDNTEIKLIIEAAEANFKKIETEVTHLAQSLALIPRGSSYA